MQTNNDKVRAEKQDCYICEPNKYIIEQGAVVPLCDEHFRERHFPTKIKDQHKQTMEERFEKEFPQPKSPFAESIGLRAKILNFISQEISSALEEQREEERNNHHCCKYQTDKRDDFCDYCLNKTSPTKEKA